MYEENQIAAAAKVIEFIDSELGAMQDEKLLCSKSYYHEIIHDFYRDNPFYEGDFADHLIKAVNLYKNNRNQTYGLVVDQLMAAKKLLQSDFFTAN